MKLKSLTGLKKQDRSATPNLHGCALDSCRRLAAEHRG
jgi:hypothetical protein